MPDYLRHGYNRSIFMNVRDIPEKYMCIFCTHVVRRAVQAPHIRDPKIVCMDCYNRNLKNGICPLSGKYNEKIYPDKFADREIGQYVVECENKHRGCVWRNRTKDYEEHLEKCDYGCPKSTIEFQAIHSAGQSNHEALIARFKELEKENIGLRAQVEILNLKLRSS